MKYSSGRLALVVPNDNLIFPGALVKDVALGVLQALQINCC